MGQDMVSIALLRTALEAAWGPDTSYPDSGDQWRPENPSRNQCGTALVVHDLLGGEIILGDVEVQGRKTGNHYWNRLPDGTELDFTADQFLPGEVTTNGRVVTRPPEAPRRHRTQYELLRLRVDHLLASGSTELGARYAGELNRPGFSGGRVLPAAVAAGSGFDGSGLVRVRRGWRS